MENSDSNDSLDLYKNLNVLEKNIGNGELVEPFIYNMIYGSGHYRKDLATFSLHQGLGWIKP